MSAYILFNVSQEQVKNIQLLQTASDALFHDSMKMIIFMLISLEVLNCKELFDNSSSEFKSATRVAILGIAKFIASKIYEKYATGESFFILCLESMTAYSSWLPHLEMLRNNSSNKEIKLNYSCIGKCTYLTTLTGKYAEKEFQFNSQNL